MQKSHWAALIAVVILIVGGFVVARSLYFGGATTNLYTPPEVELSGVDLEQAAVSARIPVELPSADIAEGAVLVDFAHDNALFVEELNNLFSRLVSEGLQYELITPEDVDAEENGDSPLIERLKYAKALISPLPRANYTPAEQEAIERFVDNGGRILIIGDPTRTVEVNALNSIAGSFGVVYANDYLYSLHETSMDNNYRNVVYTNFIDSPITEGLTNGDKVIFYSGGSVTAPGREIILGDDFTESSTSESDSAKAAAALTANDQVLALGDLTFFSDPYSAAESNGTLINNIAGFLAGGQRTYELRDFPYYFNDNVDVVFDNTRVFNSQFEDSVKLKDMLEADGHKVSFTNSLDTPNDVIYVGRFDETEPVQEYLDAAGIVILEPEPTATPAAEDILVADADQPAEENGANGTDDATQADPNADENMDADFVEGRIQIDGVGELERGGSTLFYRYQDGDRNVLIILSANPDTNADAFSLLMDDELSTCTVGEAVAVCQTESPGDKEIPSIRSTRVDKILVVGDDEGRPRLDDKTSEAEFESALGDTYKVTTWLTSADGRPTLDELQEYDAVVWTTGDYWDDSLDTEDADLLTNYIEAGGNLILSGASIAFDWDHTEFLENIVHTDYLTFAQQQDIEVASEDHPIARDFALGDVITLTVTEVVDVDPVMPDVVTHTPDARVIFRRGPDSEQPGAPTVIAYEDDRAKVAYYAFPVYELPEEARNTLLMNTVDWFTRKPLDLPDKEDYEPFQTDDTATVDVGEEPPADEGTPPADGETPPADDTGNGEDNGTGDDNGNDSGNGDQNTTQNGSSN